MSLLSPRELEVAVLYASGLSAKEVSRRLVIAPGTVGQHLVHINRKLGTHSRDELATALRIGSGAMGEAILRGNR
jgi:DNA-binding CsgD family transcriptional regulator